MALFLLTFSLILAGSVLAVLLYIGSVSATNNGWKDLAARFRYRETIEGSPLRLVSATLNDVFLQRIINVTAIPEGLVLCGILPFRPSHPQILIPWRQLGSNAFHDDRGPGYRLRIADLPEMKLEWTENTHERLRSTISTAWPDAQRAMGGDPPP